MKVLGSAKRTKRVSRSSSTSKMLETLAVQEHEEVMAHGLSTCNLLEKQDTSKLVSSDFILTDDINAIAR